MVISWHLSTSADLVRPPILQFSRREWELELVIMTNESAMKFYITYGLSMSPHIKI